ncbi:MAG: hypothetical protein WBM50_15450 [Acidimicrobiales bacterium]
MTPVTDDQTARRYHRAGLGMMMRQAVDVDGQATRAQALLWLLERLDDPPSTTDPGDRERKILATWAATLERSKNLPTVAGSRERSMAVADRARNLRWGLAQAAEVTK